MGCSIDASLVYGYDLGSAEADDGWLFNKEPDSYDVNWPSWMLIEDDEPDDPTYQFEERLLAIIGGFTEEAPDLSADWTKWRTRKTKAMADSKLDLLTFDIYGVSDYTGWVFGVKVIDGDGCITEVKSKDLAETPVNVYDDLLKRCLEVLEITLEGSPEPKLLLIASYG